MAQSHECELFSLFLSDLKGCKGTLHACQVCCPQQRERESNKKFLFCYSRNLFCGLKMWQFDRYLKPNSLWIFIFSYQLSCLKFLRMLLMLISCLLLFYLQACLDHYPGTERPFRISFPNYVFSRISWLSSSRVINGPNFTLWQTLVKWLYIFQVPYKLWLAPLQGLVPRNRLRVRNVWRV